MGFTSFYTELRDAAISAGVQRNIWADFVWAIRGHSQPILCWNGTPAGGRLILRAWRREWRVGKVRASQIAQPLIARLLVGAAPFLGGLQELKCCRAYEAALGAPPARLSKKVPLSSARTLNEISRYYFDMEDGVFSSADLDGLDKMFQTTNSAEQKKVLDLFLRPLGKRSRPPRECHSPDPPNPERLDCVWVSLRKDVLKYPKADELRDALGLVHFRTGDKIILFEYNLPDHVSAFIPTTVEALSGWAFWPGLHGQAQRTVNYRTGDRGPREFVHAADIGPDLMRFRWLGTSSRNWDDPL